MKKKPKQEKKRYSDAEYSRLVKTGKRVNLMRLTESQFERFLRSGHNKSE